MSGSKPVCRDKDGRGYCGRGSRPTSPVGRDVTCGDCKAAMRADLAAAARSPGGNRAPLDSGQRHPVSLTVPPPPGAADKEQP